MDGVDLDIEIGSHRYYPDFVREMRRLMNTDPSKQYLITAAPQCPFPDKWMGPQIQGSALEGWCYYGTRSLFCPSTHQPCVTPQVRWPLHHSIVLT